MRKAIAWFVLVVLCAGSVFARVEMMDLSGGCTLSFSNVDQWCKVLERGDSRSLAVGWNASKHKWAEYWFAGKSIMHFNNVDEIKVTVTCKSQGASDPKNIGLRFVDSQGEILEIFPVSEPTLFPDGTMSVVYVLRAAATIPGGWKHDSKAKVNGKVDFPVSLQGFSVSYPKDSGIGVLNISSIRVETTGGTGAADLITFKMDLTTMHPVRVVDPADNGYLLAEVRASGHKEEFLFSARLTIRDASGKAVGEPLVVKDCMIWPRWHDARRRFMLTAPKKYGMYTVVAELMLHEEGGRVVTLTRPFAVAKLTGAKAVPLGKEDFRFGVHCEMLSPEMAVWQEEARAIAQIGIRYVRNSTGMNVVMTSPETFDFDIIDGYVNYYQQLGIEPMLLMGLSAFQWAHEKPHKKGDSGVWAEHVKPDIWKTYCDAVFRHFRGRIKSIEVCNEPDLPYFYRGTAEQYSELAHIAKASRDEFAPDIQLMSAGFCSFESKNQFHENAMKLCGKCFDIHCFHGHGVFGGYRKMISGTLLPMRERLGLAAIPWYPHETAITSTGRSEDEQAQTLWKKLIYSWSVNAIGYTWYDFRNNGFEATNAEHNYGLITYDFYPKAAYVAYNALCGVFNGPTRFVDTIQDELGADIYVFKRQKDALLCAWVHDKATPGRRFFNTDATSAEIMDIYGNVTPATVDHGRVMLEIGKSPVVLRLKNGSYIRKNPGILSARTNTLSFKEGRASLDVELQNTNNRDGEVELTVLCPAGVAASVSKVKVAVEAGARVKRTIEFKGDTSKMVIGSSVLIKGVLPGVGESELQLGVQFAAVITASFGAKPTFTLDSAEQVVEQFDANPGEVHRLRQDNDDLSAKVYLAADSRSLVVRVDVEDDAHAQPFTGDRIWEGDSIQVFLKFAGSSVVWQLGCALQDDGSVQKAVWGGEANNTVLKDMKCQVTRKGTKTFYLMTIPWKSLQVDWGQVRKHGLRFNLLLNERDTDERDAWMQVSPGAGDGIDASLFPMVNIGK